jgi:hypothetical protein
MPKMCEKRRFLHVEKIKIYDRPVNMTKSSRDILVLTKRNEKHKKN